MACTVVAVGLTVATAGFAEHYVLQAIKQMEPQIKQVFQNLSKSAFSDGYDRDAFEPKMTKQEAALILDISLTANKGKIEDVH
uniref:SLH domain-containing protein n=2 Tax=Canis lupus dingo TaxID=286419 RepID=A0A8C0LGR0_CANLU